MAKKTIEYEKNIIKQCYHNNLALIRCSDTIGERDFFEDKTCMMIWKVFMTIRKEDHKVCESTVHDVLNASNNDSVIPEFDKIVAETHKDEDQWKYHLENLEEKYINKQIIGISSDIKKNAGKVPSEEIVKYLNESLRDINSTKIKSVSIKETFSETLSEIKDIASGKKQASFKTGHAKFDNTLAINEKKLITVGSQKKIGKTRWLADLMARLMEKNSSKIAVQWYSLEMDNRELTRLFISRLTRMDDNELMGVKTSSISLNTISAIENAENKLADYPLEMVDEPLDIFALCHKFETFAASNPDVTPIMVLDNFGCLLPHTTNENQMDDDCYRMLKSLRDKTNGIIIVVHHLTKESESQYNKDDMYEPKVKHLRGSSRIADFSNAVVLLHRPENYPDLVKKLKKNNQFDMIDKTMIAIVALQRNGRTGNIAMRHEIQYCQFSEI